MVDPHANSDEVKHEYGFSLSEISGKYDAIVLAVCHDDYKKITGEYLAEIAQPNALFADLKGRFRGKISTLKYWSL